LKADVLPDLVRFGAQFPRSADRGPIEGTRRGRTGS